MLKRTRKKYDEDFKIKIAGIIYNKSLTKHEISEKYGININTVKRWGNIYNVGKPGHSLKRKLTDKKKKEIVNMVKIDGKTVSEVSKKYNISCSSVYSWIKKEKYKEIDKFVGEFKSSIKKEIYFLYHVRCMRVSEISERKKVPVQTIYNWIREMK